MAKKTAKTSSSSLVDWEEPAKKDIVDSSKSTSKSSKSKKTTKEPYDPYKMDPKTEKALTLGAISSWSPAFAGVCNLEEPLTPDEWAYVSNTQQVLMGLMNPSPDTLKEAWKNVDWSRNSNELAKIVIASARHDALVQCPLKWETLTVDRIVDRWDPKHINPSWLVEIMIKNKLTSIAPQLYNGHRISYAISRAQESFWSTMLATGRLSYHTPLYNERYTTLPTFSLFQHALIHDNACLLSKIPLPEAIRTKEEAETTLFALTSCPFFYDDPTDRVSKRFGRVLNYCTKFPIDFNRIEEERSLGSHVQALLDHWKLNEEERIQVSYKMSYDTRDYVQFDGRTLKIPDKKPVTVSARQCLFMFLMSNPRVAHYAQKCVRLLVKDLAGLPLQDQRHLLNGLSKNDDDNKYVKALECPALMKEWIPSMPDALRKQMWSALWESVGVDDQQEQNAFQSFSLLKGTLTQNDLAGIAALFMEDDKQEKKTSSKTRHCYIDKFLNVKHKKDFVELFEPSAQEQAERWALILTQDRKHDKIAHEKALLTLALLNNPVTTSPSTARKM